MISNNLAVIIYLTFLYPTRVDVAAGIFAITLYMSAIMNFIIDF